MSSPLEFATVAGGLLLAIALLVGIVVALIAAYEAGRKSTTPRCGEKLTVACSRARHHLGRCRTVHQPNRYSEPRVVRWRA